MKQRANKNPMLEWSRLAGPDRKFVTPILDQWKRLLSEPNTRESKLHEFLAKHAHIFLWNGIGFATVISKLRFGAEFVSDFVIVCDRWSDGVHYTLVEIERPDTVPFTKDGIASARLSRAIQQVLSWKTWLAEHRSEARKMFPSYLHRNDLFPVFNYEIIIGNRENTKSCTQQRQALSDALGIGIRSFDKLTDTAKFSARFEDYSSVGDEEYHYDLESRNRLACPFVCALSDPEWREVMRGARNAEHFMSNYGMSLLRVRRENEFARRFRKLHRER